MVISGEVLDGIDGHGNVYPMFVVVPLKIDAAVEISQQFCMFQCIAQKRGA